ncbi:N-acyl-D-amino-acid deacylase family protein [Brevibacterium sp. UCMA 11752]|uniref:N-acyl-D-amino-acid deacylase family protein n=1 Tax=Brevibacterium sp. UCMA 11752 TaxID=2745946 RepID=UPI001F2C5434|nr:D-aminoacylase [Brevibacterium sp. UCMA 11752]MCF2586929.1 D-aminoacylase [Brevibacterium sp. UCMA 11752]
MLDLLITNARIVDGTGRPGFPGQVGIEAGRITLVEQALDHEMDDDRHRSVAKSDVESKQARRVLDARGQVLSPGFIDLHSHADFSIMSSPAAETQLAQGVTTALVGNCGSSPFPARSVDAIQQDNAHLDAVLSGEWSDAQGYAEEVSSLVPGINLALQVGLSSIRNYVMGPVDEAPNDAQLKEMTEQVARAADAGVFGFSSGLIYTPGSYARPAEVEALVTEAAKRGLLYSTHMRNESNMLLEAVGEAIETADRAGAKLEVSHLKSMGPENYGLTVEALRLIEKARQRGLDIKADVYPYTASSTRLTSRLPGYALDGGKKALLERLVDPQQRLSIGRDMASRFGRDIDPEGVVIASLGEPGSTGAEYYWTIGKSLAEIGRQEGCSAEEAAMRVLVAHDASVGIVNHAMSPDDVASVLAHPLVSVASDGWTMSATGTGKPHPRSFGTFAHVLGKYVREDGLISLEEAVRKMTSQPAERLDFTDRGIVEVGRIADIVIFDPDTIRQNATYDDPWQLATGVSTVLIHGNAAVEDGSIDNRRFGRVLRKG